METTTSSIIILYNDNSVLIVYCNELPTSEARTTHALYPAIINRSRLAATTYASHISAELNASCSMGGGGKQRVLLSRTQMDASAAFW